MIRKIASLAVGLIVFGGIAVLAGAFIWGFIHGIVEDTKDYPGKAQFKAANQKIFVYQDTVAFGNTPEATTFATEFSSLLEAQCQLLFSGGSKLTPATGGHFLTYCRLTPTQVVVLCQVPDLRGYKEGEVRDTLSKIAWSSAQTIAISHKLPPGTPLAIGLRGFASYGPVWEGKVSGDATVKGDGPDEENRLYPYFAPAPDSPK